MNKSVIIVALILGTLPILVINVNYLIAAAEGYVPWCVPYWDSCTSISATGREGTAFFFFKATMLPMSLVYFLYWKLVTENLATFGSRGRAIYYLGIIASAALAIYTVALGAVGDQFQLTRRIGIIFYFAFTFLNQLLHVLRMTRHRIPDPTRSWQLAVCVIVLGLGILTVILDALLENYDDYEDAFEWTVAVIMHGNFLLSYFGWRALIGTADLQAVQQNRI
jgi:hypothetical protein